MSNKPNVIIFGGLQTVARHLVLHLLTSQPTPLVSSIRLVDKFSLYPATTYLGKPFADFVADTRWKNNGVFEYLQANLTKPGVVKSCFSPPRNGQRWTRVIDLTGELSFYASDEVQKRTTYDVAVAIGQAAVEYGEIEAYIRHSHQSTYLHKLDLQKRSGYSEDEKEGCKVWGARGIWLHEAVRALSRIEGLPLVIMRTAYIYGPHYTRDEIVLCTLHSQIEYYMSRGIQLIGSRSFGRNTVHVDDVVGAIWAAADWAAQTPSSSRFKVPLFSSDFSSHSSTKAVLKSIVDNGLADTLHATVFNVVDDGNAGQGMWGDAMIKFVGVEVEYVDPGFFKTTLMNFKLEEIITDLNEVVMDGWAEMIQQSDPPMTNPSVLSPFVEPHVVLKQGCSLNGNKVKEILGYKMRYPQFSVETVREMVEAFRKDGAWPNVKGRITAVSTAEKGSLYRASTSSTT